MGDGEDARDALGELERDTGGDWQVPVVKDVCQGRARCGMGCYCTTSR